MKSICIKTNDSKILYYLLDSFNDISLDNVYFSFNEFKSYKNAIIHYKGNDIKTFNIIISDILSFLVIDNFEESIIKKLILNNYFYFDNLEIEKVFNICIDLLSESNEYSIDDRLNLLSKIFYDYISDNKQIVLNGFINFRLKDYFSLLISKFKMSN